MHEVAESKLVELAIPTVLFSRIYKLEILELVNAGEKHCWYCEFNELALCDLVHFLQFIDVFLEVRRVGRACG